MVVSGNSYSTIDLQRSRLRLRDDLVFVPQLYRGATYYHIESPTTSSFYRVGFAEYVFLSLLDGETSFAEALALTSRRLGSRALTSQEALQTYTWILENKLGQLTESGHNYGSERPAGDGGSILRKLNPFWLKLPLCRPDRAVAAAVPLLGWCFSPAVTVVGVALIASACVALASNGARLAAASDSVFAPGNWLWMGITWLALKVLHEFAHAVACRRYGCEVREMGLVFVLFAPLAYVDVTSSWRLSSKWQRMQIAMAGMYAELVSAAVAAFLWLSTDSQLASHLLYNVMLMASISTIAFNANPLMRFDGYYLLSDLLELPNLYAEGSRAVRRQLARFFWGERTGEPEQLGSMAWIVSAYGWLAAGWRLLVGFSLTLVASVLFHGAGVMIAALGVVSWYGKPMLGFCQSATRRRNEAPRTVWRAGLLATAVAGGIWCLLCLPTPNRVSAPAVVEYRDVVHVRTMTEGFVGEVLVADGDLVNAGDVLIRLNNRDVSNQYHELRFMIDQSQLRERIATDEGDASLAQVERRNQMALRQQLAEATRRYEALQIRAPVAGKIVDRGLNHLPGRHLDEGDRLLSIGAEEAKDLVVSVSEDDFDSVVPHVGDSVTIRVGSLQRLTGRFVRLEPRATLELPHAALAASEGGMLVVTRSESGAGDQPLKLTAPRFRAVVSVPTHQASQIFSGQRGRVSFGWDRESIGENCYRYARKWIANKLAHNS